MPLCADLTPSEETGVDWVLDVADVVRAVTVDWYGGGVTDDTVV
jgi:hypothetical protein